MLSHNRNPAQALSYPFNTQSSCLSDPYNRTFNTNAYPFYLSHSHHIHHVSRLFGDAIALELRRHNTHPHYKPALLGALFRRYTPANFYSLCRTQLTLTLAADCQRWSLGNSTLWLSEWCWVAIPLCFTVLLWFKIMFFSCIPLYTYKQIYQKCRSWIVMRISNMCTLYMLNVSATSWSRFLPFTGMLVL